LTEVLKVTSAIQKALLDGGHADKIHEIALKDGFISMGLDGLVKALRGQTTISEVLRVLAV
jgi:type II secretory ATPase GspE/PulE/Tfp pilus assembly ATPase PilB-like protein